MTKNTPYLVIYNSKNNTLPENINQEDFVLGYFKEKAFTHALIDKICAKTTSNQTIVIIDAETKLPPFWFERLLQVLTEKPQTQLCSALTCKKNSLSPLVAGDKFMGSVDALDNIIYLKQLAGTIYTNDINNECFIIRNKKALASLKDSSLLKPFYACNNLFSQAHQQNKAIELTQIKDIGNQKPLPAHPLAKLQWQLKHYLQKTNTHQDYPLLDKKPIILHISMNWGGGVHQWIDDYCQNENSYHHLILSTDGELYRQTHGESLGLRYHQTDGVFMSKYEMQAPIKSTCIEHSEYKSILQNIIHRYQIKLIMVSSLIGHSMECLQTGVPTIKVFHDYFPSWPSLIAHLDKDKIDEIDLAKAFEQSKKEPFGEIKKQQYQKWKTHLHKIYQSKQVKLVAPSQSVVDNLKKIDATAFSDVEVIPHAIKFFKPLTYANNLKAFQILILGRINPPKGQELLEKIIQELGLDYRFIMLGAGNEGKKYLKKRNIAVIAEYENENLEKLLQETEPDIAIITSQTSETFNYTLSELQQAGICTLSTKFGALNSRIIDGKTGFLCDNNVNAFVTKIRELQKNPKTIKTIRSHLNKLKLPSFDDEIKSYQKLFPKLTQSKRLLTQVEENNIYVQKLIHTTNESNRISALLKESETSLDERTKWGKTLTKELDEKARWEKALTKELEDRTKWGKTLTKELDEKTKWSKSLTKELENAIKNIELERKEAQNLKQIITQERKIQKRESTRMMAELDEHASWGKSLTKELENAVNNIELERKEAKHLKQVIEKERTSQKRENSRMMKEIKQLNQSFESTNKLLQKSQSNLKETISHKELIEQQLLNTQQIAEDKQQEIESKQQEIDKIQSKLTQTKIELSKVYQSRSWRLTKPVRKITTWARHRRNTIKFRFGQIKTLPTRAIRSLKTRGFVGTLGVVKNKFNKKHPQAKSIQNVETPQHTSYKPTTINRAETPTVSIIIPVYNHFNHTYNCLESIAQLKDNCTFEVIVVDDCSTDETEDLIKNISGILYQRQTQNGGFIESCNTGAKLAQGKYLMFLNNDTVVYNNWLDGLIHVFDHYSDAGLVGSKLVYPDNQLQEAGGIIFSDASGWNYGRLGKPDEPWYNHIREVDYCSGASILIEAEIFKSLGYFDERYKPAYYEDTDLAFAIRNMGKKVYYQPASKITHFEGISSGTDLSAGTKKYQVVNQVKFKEKWAKALAKQPKSGSDIELCRIHGQPKRILIFDACTPMPDQDSGSLRMINIIKILKELNYHVIFMPENLSYNHNYTHNLQLLGVECIYTPSITNPVDFLKEKGKYLDAVILSRYYVAEPVMPFIREYCPKAQIIFDTVDLHYVRERRMAELEQDKKLAKMAEVTRKKELAVAKACDTTLVVSPYEVEVLGKEIPKTTVKVLTNIHEIYGCRKTFKQRKDIMFIGGYQHTPNVDAVEWFVKDIFPLIEKELPDLKFHIIGSKAPKHIQAMASKNIIFQGFVEDIEPVMDDIRIAVAPLRYGAGVKGKVNMSMSYGQPVVGTKVAVEGMFTVDEKDCLMAETPQEFAKQVIRLYQDEQLWNQISKGGLENVQNYFSFEAAKVSIKNILFK